MSPEEMNTLALEWNDHQVLAYEADMADDPLKATRHREAATRIEQDLVQAGTDIRNLVCP